MERVFTISSEADVEVVAKELISFVRQFRVVAFHGDMGVGKTTFIKALCKQMGVEDRVTSPSFALVNEYQTSNNVLIFHFDFYRLENPSELLDMGYEDYFYSDNICLVEWPEKASEIFPPQHLKIYMNEKPEGERTLRVIG